MRKHHDDAVDALHYYSGDLDAMYEPHHIPDDYPRTRRTLITVGWLGLIASITFVVWYTLRIVL